MKNLKNKLFGNKQFYRNVITVAMPIMIQNAITNFVSLLDNIMVGRVGTEQMSGVAIVNQIMFVFYLSIFGALAGAGIFGAQFYGNGDHKGVRHTFRFKLYASILLVVIGIALFLTFGEELIMLYLNGEGTEINLEATLEYGKQYLAVMLIGLVPFALQQVYASTLRECGETLVPMVAGIIAVMVNLVLNAVLIFGLLGFPALGVVGAAVATVISRYVEFLIIVIWAHTHTEKAVFAKGVYKEWSIPKELTGKIIKKGMPLLVNEFLWSAGMATLMQCYSMRGLEAVSALNISSTISNLFNVVFLSMGNAVAIMVGQLLGAGKLEEAKDTDTKLLALSVMSCVVMGGLLSLFAPVFPQIYNTTDTVKELATKVIRVTAYCMPLHGFMHGAYFTLRSGGKAFITFLFDSAYMWVVSIPLAYVLSRYTGLQVVSLYLFINLIDIIKCTVGFILVKKGVWLNRLVAD